MKTIIFIMTLFLSFQIHSQRNNETLQSKEFDLANHYLKKSDAKIAMNYFYSSGRCNSKTKMGELAIKKADSLKIVVKKEFINELIGNWKMFDDVPSWVMRDDNSVSQMIKISPEEIQFYELKRNAKNWELTKTEKIIYDDLLSNESSYSDIVYSDNTIWNFYRDENTGYLNLTHTGEKTPTGRSEIFCGTTRKTYFKLQ
ncbi:hypothetical protein [Flavobacterium sp. FlaQc-48]|uniref:hypothetical protein n=1 Tax=Flavobacterium sp. FlaQc-48 TaxID=3374181 RepID=UPI0037569203